MSENKILLIIIIIAAFCWLFGCESEEEKEKKELLERIEQLEDETSYLIHKLEKKK